MKVDYVVVGSGLTGSVIARLLKDAGKQVLVVEKRAHVGGLVYDESHPSGIRLHTYGPHLLRTSSDYIWKFLNSFGSFYKHECIVHTLVDGNYMGWPVSKQSINKIAGPEWKPAFRGKPGNFEEACLTIMPQIAYNKFVKGYTEKQWGKPADSLSIELARRFSVRQDDDPRFKLEKHQGFPVDGYAKLMTKLLSGIPVILNCDYLRHRSEIQANRLLIFTGPIDEFFDFKFGKLAYRGQRRRHTYFPDIDYLQPSEQVNNPDPATPHIRSLEWKYIMPEEYRSRIKGTLITEETPYTPENPLSYEYPFPDELNRTLYLRYKDLLHAVPGVLICGRLGEYRYLDMDHAVERAMTYADRIIGAAELTESLYSIIESCDNYQLELTELLNFANKEQHGD
jgi:UDP-galactopyranose mutase